MQIQRIQSYNTNFNGAPKRSIATLPSVSKKVNPMQAKYPEAYKQFMQLTESGDKDFARLELTDCCPELDEKILTALSKSPDRFKEFAKMKWVKGESGRITWEKNSEYLLNVYEVADLTHASKNCYNEIIKVLNNSKKWGHVDHVGVEQIIKVAEIMKLRPQILTEIDNIFSSREGSRKYLNDNMWASLLTDWQKDLIYPHKFIDQALKKDKDGKYLLSDKDIKELTPAYIKNPKFTDELMQKRISVAEIVRTVDAAEKKYEKN